MKRTYLEIKNDLTKLGDVGMKYLYFYLSLVLIMQSPLIETTFWVIAPFSIVIAALAWIYGIWFVWLLLSINDYNGENYIFNTTIEHYFGRRGNKKVKWIELTIILILLVVLIILY